MDKKRKGILIFRSALLGLFTGAGTWWLFFMLPAPLFDDPFSAVLLDRDGLLLNARIAQDEQWRFPENMDVPEKFSIALTTFEDKRFFRHSGVDVVALGRAMWSNIRAGHVVSGGSTLTMQLMRLSCATQDRTITQKLYEMLLAYRAELRYSKDEILGLYSSHAPFGGNVVGIDAASWRYFGKPAETMSWAEAACLAVLPNSPALIHPGRDREALKRKRDELLMKLADRGVLDSLEVALAMMEPLPDAPQALPQLATHLLSFLRGNETGLQHTTIRKQLQEQVLQVLQMHHSLLAQNAIQNGAILVLDTESGEVLAYAGNVQDEQMRNENAVDMVQARRSSGSILKPFLYTSALSTGEILPTMLLEDIPTNIRGYQPKNFTRNYLGMVPANEALARSLNVPAVLLLQEYGLERFRQDLQHAGLTTITQSSDYYGLPLILGGAEVTLWDICGVYASMGRTLSHAYPYNHRYLPDDLHGPIVLATEKTDAQTKPVEAPPLWDYGALWVTMNALRELARPGEDGQWESFSSQKPVAWKTGTSIGFRDAWAVGVTPDFTVGVWIGNADGEGRPELIGARAAAPVLFDVFRNLPGNSWWNPPYDALEQARVCSESGYLAGPDCPDADSLLIPLAGAHSAVCPYHRTALADPEGRYTYYESCAPGDAYSRAFFTLPAEAAAYYRKSHPTYMDLPPMAPDCTDYGLSENRQIALLYPQENAHIAIPRELNGSTGKAVMQAAHRLSTGTLYWYLDDTYLGKTVEFHTMEMHPASGKHTVTIVSPEGERVQRHFVIAGA